LKGLEKSHTINMRNSPLDYEEVKEQTIQQNQI